MFPTFRVAKFYDRTEYISDMNRFFEKHGDDETFPSLALWGLGGVGKSSLALRFAETKIREEQLDVLFWIRSEKEVTMKQSFTEMAVKLKLPGANAVDHSENKVLVMSWLQQTSKDRIASRVVKSLLTYASQSVDG
jgi:hypothetical protein